MVSNPSYEQSKQIAEASRESEWAKPSFGKELFLGNFRLDLIHPQPKLDPDAVAKGERFLTELRTVLEAEVDPLEIERTSTIPDNVVDALKRIGAMGMNSGIHDAVNLGQNMLRVLLGQEGEGALDRYVRQRRHVATEHVQTATITNKRNMEQRDPEKRNEYNDQMRRTAADPVLAKKFLMRTSLVDSLRDAASIS